MKPVFSAMLVLLGGGLTACGTASPGPNTTINCATSSVGTVTAAAGSTVVLTFVQYVSLTDPADPGTNLPLQNGTGQIYASQGITTICTGPVASCTLLAGSSTSAPVKTDSFGVATFAIATQIPAANQSGSAGVLEVFGAAGPPSACTISVTLSGQ